MMRLSEALDQATFAGVAIQRHGWNGKGMFVYYVEANNYKATSPVAIRVFGKDSFVPYGAYFAIKAADGKVYPWAPSQQDLNSDDWSIL